MGRKVFVVFLLLASVWSCSRSRPAEELLVELDGYVSARDLYVVRKKDRMAAIRDLALSARDPLRRYELEMELADGFFPFSFDSTQACLKRCQELSGSDKERFDLASIRLGHLYAKAGNYMEAHNLLYGQLDSASLSGDLKAEYLMALYDFSRDLAGNSGMVERLSIPPAEGFRKQLLEILPAHSDAWRVLMRDLLMDEDRLVAADSLSRLLISGTNQDEHQFAIYAFYMSEIAERMGRPDERLLWLVRSAESDIVNAVKDYASLTMVAQHILPTDVDRSFQYLRIAQEDALAYNAKLRPWQISRFLMDVEDAYADRQVRSRKLINGILFLLAVLAVILSVVSWFFVKRSRRLTRMRKELESTNAELALANSRLNELNREISKSDQVKEEHILSFLEGLSGQIHHLRSEDNRFRNLLKQGKADQLLKELSISGRSEKARDEFYESFDATFLAMYSDFVEQFNALLKEEARMYPPKGRLNTELRIFALIRLGVDDSKKIASMLDYSVSTIYNYKVSVKNAALGDRETFEERVKMIGK